MKHRENHQTNHIHNIRKNHQNNTPALIAILLIAGLAIIAAHPVLAATTSGTTSTGLTAVPHDLNVTKATETLNTAIADGYWTRAAAYAELIATNDENAPANIWCKWGYSLRKMGKYDDAVAKVTTAIEKDPDNAMSYINRGYAYLALEEYRNARMDAEEALELVRESESDSTQNSGTALTSDCAAAGDDTAASAYNVIALGLLGEGDAKNALVAVDTALILQPDHAHYLTTKGMVLMELGKYGDAVTTLTRAVELQDTYIAPYPDAIPPEENLATAQKLYDENQAPIGLIIAAAVIILIIGAGAIFLQRRK